MAVGAQARLGELKRAEDQIDDLLGSVRCRGGLEHLDGMAPVGEAGAAKGIPQGLGPKQRRRLAIGGQRRSPVLIERRSFFVRQPLEDLLHVGFDVGQLFGD